MKESSVIHQYGEIGPYVSHLFTISENEVTFSEAILIKYGHQCDYPFYHLISLKTEIQRRGQGLATKNLLEINNFLMNEGIVGILENGILPTNPCYTMYEKNGWKKSNKYTNWMMYNKPEAINNDDIDKMIEYLITEECDDSLESIEVRLSSYGE